MIDHGHHLPPGRIATDEPTIATEPTIYWSLAEGAFNGTNLAPASTGTTTTMDASVWSLTPPVVMDRALLFLPRSSQARFCAVCKRWAEVMSSPQFRAHSFQRQRARAVSVLRVARPECAVDAQERAWLERRFLVRRLRFRGLSLPRHRRRRRGRTSW